MRDCRVNTVHGEPSDVYVPLPIPDAMVERAAETLCDFHDPERFWSDAPEYLRQEYRIMAREVLKDALTPEGA